MAIKVRKNKWYTARETACFARLAKHVDGHYPKDHSLHKAVRGVLQASDQAVRKAAKAAKKSAKPKRRTARRAAPRRRRRVARRRVRRAS